MIRMRGEIRSKNDDGSFIYDVTNSALPFHQEDSLLNNLSADFFDVLETKGSISSEFLFKAHSFSEAKTYQNKKANAVVTRYISSNQKTNKGYAVQSANILKPYIFIRGAKIRSFTIEFDHNNSVFPTQMTVREYRSENELPAFRPDETLTADYEAIGNAYTVTNDSYSYKFVSANLPDMISIKFDYLNKPNYPVVITRIAANEIYYLDKRNLISSSLSFGYGQDVNEPEMEIANYEDTIVALDDTGDLQRMEAEGALIGADVVLWLEDTITHRIEYYYHRVIDSIQYNNDTKQATLKISSGIKSLQSVYPDPVYGFDNVGNDYAWENILMDYNYLDVFISPKNAVFYIQNRRLFNITTVYKGVHGDKADTKSFWVLITELCECAGATFAIDQNGVYTFYASNSDSV